MLESIDLIWVLVATGQIFFMQVGFTMLETGVVRKKNRNNILLKNLLDTCIGALAFYSMGFAFANQANGGIIGTNHFFASNMEDHMFLKWIFPQTGKRRSGH